MGLNLLDPSIINITISSEVDNNNESMNFNNFSFFLLVTSFDLILSANEWGQIKLLQSEIKSKKYYH